MIQIDAKFRIQFEDEWGQTLLEIGQIRTKVGKLEWSSYQDTTGVGNVRRLRDLLVLLESLGIGILDEDVEHDQVFFGVPQDDLLHGAGG